MMWQVYASTACGYNGYNTLLRQSGFCSRQRRAAACNWLLYAGSVAAVIVGVVAVVTLLRALFFFSLGSRCLCYSCMADVLM
jgi:hypothetical protein